MSKERPLIVILAEEILTMHYENTQLKKENKRLQNVEKEHIDFLNQTIKNGNETMNNWIGFLITDASKMFKECKND